MAPASISSFTIFVLVSSWFEADGQTNKTVTNTGSTSDCICDLLVDGCDPNCCCDTDCGVADKESFTECKESQNVIFDERVCVSDQMIFIKNVPFKTENTGDGLFCIIRNNNQNQDEYSNVDIITNDGDFTNLINSKNLYSYDVEDKSENAQFEGNYKVGDRIFLLHSNQTKGYLSLPTSLDHSSCNDFNPAGYLQDSITQCERSFVDFPTQCLNLATLSASSYFSGFQVAKTPEAFSVHSSNKSDNVSLLFEPTLSSPLLCREESSILNQCDFTIPPDPKYNTSTKTCENVVTQVSYTFIYSNESTNLVRLNVSLVLENVQGNFLQMFSMKFLKEGVTETFTKSGNPGYLTDQPLLAGSLINDPTTNKKAILLSTNTKDWLTIMRASLDGSCSSSVNHRLSVTFNINTRSGCMIRLNKSSNCSLLQEIAFTALLGINTPDYVASFGNSDVTNAADWVKIINDKPGNRATGSQGACENMVLGLHIEILFAKIGYLANPQAKIVGARFKYEQAKTITYQCFGQFCQDRGGSGSQLIEVVSSVSFVDISESPSQDYKSLPEFQSKAPSDFFHPFL